MKKLIASLAVVAALFAAGSVCAACDSRWEYIGQSTQSQMKYYVDNTRLEYSPSSDLAKAWIKEEKPNTNAYAILHYQINYKNNTYYEGDVATIYTPGNVQTERNPGGNRQIIPDSVGEAIANYVAGAVNRDEKRAAYEKEQEDKKADAEREKTVKKGVSLLRGALGL